MTYEIVLEDVTARPIAAVHASVPVGHVAEAWRPALDKVWAFLRSHDGLRTDGHNVFVYHHPVRPGAPLQPHNTPLAGWSTCPPAPAEPSA